jgi:tripartite ATP-independent transporter DctM subunit
MDTVQVGIAGIAIMLLLVLLRVPVGLAMMAVGAAGYAFIVGLGPALNVLASFPVQNGINTQLAVIPLFVLMGQLAVASGISQDLYRAAYAWIGHWRGGLAGATIVSSAGFAALSGSSLAAAVTMGSVALPEMKRYNYSNRLSMGTVAAGGTLGILIPPSTGFILYAILTEESIGRLFIAGVVPGLMLTGLFLLAIFITTALRPELGPRGQKFAMAERLRSTWRAAPMLIIVALVIGGLYFGIFTPNEAAGFGAFFTFVMAVIRRTSPSAFLEVFLSTVRTSGMVFLIIIGAYVFNPFLALTGIPALLGEWAGSLGLAPWLVLLGVLGVFIVLGTFLEGLAMLVMALPVVFPLVMQLGYDPIWFGVIIVLVLEMGLITPPMGMNVFVVRETARSLLSGDTSLQNAFIGVIPFFLAMLAAVAALLLVPEIALFLPGRMFN